MILIIRVFNGCLPPEKKKGFPLPGPGEEKKAQATR